MQDTFLQITQIPVYGQDKLFPLTEISTHTLSKWAVECTKMSRAYKELFEKRALLVDSITPAALKACWQTIPRLREMDVPNEYPDDTRSDSSEGLRLTDHASGKIMNHGRFRNGENRQNRSEGLRRKENRRVVLDRRPLNSWNGSFTSSTRRPRSHRFETAKQTPKFGRSTSEPSRAADQPNVICYNCKQPGHIATDCPEPRRQDRNGALTKTDKTKKVIIPRKSRGAPRL